MTVTQPRPVYDVAIVGSGAGGATAADMGTKVGADVITLEAGPNTPHFGWPRCPPEVLAHFGIKE